MRLVNPGTGEISDRLTILALKIRAGGDAGKDVTHFEVERAALLTKIHARTLNAQWFDAFVELGAVNAFLWQAEDDLRGHRANLTPVDAKEGIRIYHTVAHLAVRIQELNDRRAALIEQINKEAGDPAEKEKL